MDNIDGNRFEKFPINKFHPLLPPNQGYPIDGWFYYKSVANLEASFQKNIQKNKPLGFCHLNDNCIISHLPK